MNTQILIVQINKNKKKESKMIIRSKVINVYLLWCTYTIEKEEIKKQLTRMNTSNKIKVVRIKNKEFDSSLKYRKAYYH